MPLNVISNFAANVAHRYLAQNDMQMTDSLAKLSAGTRVLSAKDDAASLAIGNRLAAEVAGLAQAQVNAGQGISMLQIADGAMSKVNDILQRMKSLSVEAGSGQLSSTERSMINTEYSSLISEVDRISKDTQFAGTQLVGGSVGVSLDSGSNFQKANGVDAITFKGSFNTSTNSKGTISYATGGQFSLSQGGTTYTGSLGSGTNDGTNMSTGTVVTLSNSGTTNTVQLQIDQAFQVNTAHANSTATLSGSSTSSFTYKVGTGTDPNADDISVSVDSISATQLGIESTDVTTAANADTASTAVSNAIDDIQRYRANIGASQNRLQFASDNIATTKENTEAARSALMDLDVASEMSNFTSKQILVQSGVAMLAQANKMPQQLMRLFQ